MTDGTDDHTPDTPPFDEVASKRFGRQVRRSVDFREEVLSRDPASVVDPAAAAAVLGIQVDDLSVEMDEGRLGYVQVDGERVIRVVDLRAAYDNETRRLGEASKGFTELNAPFGWEE